MVFTITTIAPERKQAWDTLVARESSFALFQSWEWGEYKANFGWHPVRIGVEEQGELIAGAQLLIKPFPLNVASIVYVPRGPVGDWLNEAVTPELLSAIIRVAKQHRAALVRFEPGINHDPEIEQRFLAQNFHLSYSNQPNATILVDLRAEPETLLASFHQKTRYNIRYAQRKGVQVRIGDADDLDTFVKFMNILEDRSGFKARNKAYYENEWKTFAPQGQLKMFIAEYEGKPIAVNVSVFFGQHAAYFHGASTNDCRNLMPNHLLMWEAINWAKSCGCLTYDLWGIPYEVGEYYYEHHSLLTSSRTDGLWGVYRFKKGFSEQVRLYMNALDYVCKPNLYLLAKIASNNTAIFENLAALFDHFKHKRT